MKSRLVENKLYLAITDLAFSLENPSEVPNAGDWDGKP
jgi:hypothetical protein